MAHLPASLSHAVAVSPLRRRPVAILFSALLVALLIASVAGYALWLGGQAAPVLRAFLVTLLAAAGLALPGLAVLWWLDRRERESPWVFFGVFLFGLAISLGLALLAHQALPGAWQALGLTPADLRSFDPLSQFNTPLEQIARDEALKLGGGGALLPAVLEELTTALALVLLVIFLRGEFDSVRDGIIYGALAGLGFTVGETAYHVAQGLGGTASFPLAQQLAARFVFLGLNGHLLFGALTGAGFGLARQTRWWPVRIAAPAGFLLLAVVANVVQNVFVTGIAGQMTLFLGFGGVALKSLPPQALWLALAAGNLFALGLFYAVVVDLLARSGAWEQSVIRAELAEEIGAAITEDEYRLLAAESLFGLRSAPYYPPRVSRAIVNAQNELALRKWRVRAEGGNPAQDAVVAGWRADIAALRNGH